MGCHGVAQSIGSDFSFALARGQKGALPEGPNFERPIGSVPSFNFGDDVRIQFNDTSSSFKLKQFLGVGADKSVSAPSALANQQFVFLFAADTNSTGVLENGSPVVVRSTTLDGYLTATNELAYQSGNSKWYRVLLAPGDPNRADQWAVQTLKGRQIPLQSDVPFCLKHAGPIGGRDAFLSKYPSANNFVGVTDRCDIQNSWRLQQPFAPAK